MRSEHRRAHHGQVALPSNSLPEPRRAYALLAVAGLLGTAVLLVGAGQLVLYEVPSHNSGLHAAIEGVYPFDVDRQAVDGPAATEFDAGSVDALAARVTWADLPPTTIVSGDWYDSSGALVARSGPAAAARMHPIVVAGDDAALSPGAYLFAVERWDGGTPIEVLTKELVRLR